MDIGDVAGQRGLGAARCAGVERFVQPQCALKMRRHISRRLSRGQPKEERAIAPTGAPAAVRGNRAYFGTEGGTFYAIDLPTAADELPSVAWTYRDPDRGQPIRAAAAITDKLVVYGSQGKAVYALDRATGEFKWKLPTRTRVDSSPVIAGDRVVAATDRGVLYILIAESGEPTWQFDAGGSFSASPIVVDGRIILGNGDGTLYCFGPTTNAKEFTTESTEDTEENDE